MKPEFVRHETIVWRGGNRNYLKRCYSLPLPLFLVCRNRIFHPQKKVKNSALPLFRQKISTFIFLSIINCIFDSFSRRFQEWE